MENKKVTPIITVILYLIGMIFFVISAFMLYTSIEYTQSYLQAYEMTFADMWSNSVQYIIEKFVPYLAYGVIAIGIGKAIKVVRNIQLPEVKVPEIPAPEAKIPDNILNQADTIKNTMTKVDDVKQALEEFKVITNIKLEEMEKRESFRLNETKDIINGEFDIHMANRAAAEALILKYLGADSDEIEELSISNASQEQVSTESDSVITDENANISENLTDDTSETMSESEQGQEPIEPANEGQIDRNEGDDSHELVKAAQKAFSTDRAEAIKDSEEAGTNEKAEASDETEASEEDKAPGFLEMRHPGQIVRLRNR